MALVKRYSGSFAGRRPWQTGDRVVTVEIWTDPAIGDPALPEMEFPTDCLTIEWETFDPTTPLQGSRATLRLISPGDRTYADLYTVNDGAVQLRVYVDSALWWCGYLDPETYEEPYHTDKGYEVSLTFSDFGPMMRKRYEATSATGFPESCLTTISDALSAAGLDQLPIQEHISTNISGDSSLGVKLTLSAISVNTGNWVDETGQGMTLHEIVSAILTPCALHMVQRGGSLWVYDVNALTGLSPAEVFWSSTNAKMTAAPVAGDITITFSPYSQTEPGDGSIDSGGVLRDAGAAGVHEVQIPYNIAEEDLEGFLLRYSSSEDGGNDALDPKGNNIFRIVPQNAGDDCAGVLIRATKYLKNSSTVIVNGAAVDPTTGWGVWSTSATPPVLSLTTSALALTPSDSSRYMLKVSLDFLFDPRGNPFVDADEDNAEGGMKRLKKLASIAYIPVMIELLDAAGNVQYHYHNIGTCSGAGLSGPRSWEPGSASPGDCFLAYYDTNRKDNTGLGAWATNRQSIGRFKKDLPLLYTKRGTGEYIPMPPISGRLRLTVYNGVRIECSSETWTSLNTADKPQTFQTLYNEIAWIAYKDPKVSIVRRDGAEIDTEDIVYRATAIEGAQEPCDVDLKVGTVPQSLSAPCARGALSFAGSNVSLNKASRAGFSGRLEQLLAGTLLSAYGSRRTTLSGEAIIEDSGALVRSDAAQPEGTRFIVSQESANLWAGTTDITLIEIRPDEWAETTVA